MTAEEILKEYFGYDSFRGGQRELIDASLNGEDALGIMPTGAGKSLCFQIPALMFSGISLVISPLISLMKDQVGSLIQAGVPSAYINSTLSPRQMEAALDNARNGKYKLIYVAPERLLSPDFLDFTKTVEISMLTVDEAHCISQWGQDFRPSYAQIPSFIAELPTRPVLSAYTATATLKVREDITQLLGLEKPKVLVTGFDRENLYFEVQNPRDKMQALLKFLEQRRDKNGIIYCTTRKTVEELCRNLSNSGYSASRYHAGLSDEERHQNQDDFLFDRIQIMVATNAFGMGIDKSNVSFVVHYNMPKDIESYYQEAGRAGRDGGPADCLLLYSGQDVVTNQWMIDNGRAVSSQDPETEEILKERDRKRLREMTFYSTTNDCLRAFILKYFGEAPKGYCGNCSNCNTKFDTVDVSQDVKMILSCVARMRERFGSAMVVDVLKGSKNQRITELGLNSLSTYGISDKSTHSLRAIIDFMLQGKYLDKSDGQYPVLLLGPNARAALTGQEPIMMKLAKERESQESRVSKIPVKAAVPPNCQELYRRLRQLRQDFALAQSLPAYLVFSDSSIVDMCIKLPKNSAEFRSISGVGTKKLQHYGHQFLKTIEEFCLEFPDVSPTATAKPPKRRRAPVLPNEALLETIEVFKEPVPISTVMKSINEKLRQEDCSLLNALRITNWLMEEGYLKIDETKERREKRPTEKGFLLGISQEERHHEGGIYSINLYSPAAQSFVISNCPAILQFNRDKAEPED